VDFVLLRLRQLCRDIQRRVGCHGGVIMSRKHIQNVNARRIVESVARQNLDDIDWQQRDRIVAAHNERDLQAWHEQNERDKLRRKLLAIAAPLLNDN